jgi:peptidoglycan/xylan/chitin deacetylase (PgdA/CDA1 family)
MTASSPIQRRPICALMYHHVGAAVPSMHPGLSVSPAVFSRHMQWLADRGCRGVSASDWFASHEVGSDVMQKPVILTFDDAYEETALNALPVVQSFGFSATVFVVTGYVGGENQWDQERGFPALKLMSRRQIVEWSARNIEFGAHSRSHPALQDVSPEVLEAEVGGSRKDLEQLLSREVVSFAYPYGKYDRAALERVQRHFRMAFTTAEGLNDANVPPHELRRVEVRGDESAFSFRLHLRLGYRPLERLRMRCFNVARALKERMR